MAFVDTLLSETEATIAVVDKDVRPGGHWNHAYPFVRLHQPSASYGVGSRALGTDRIDRQGLNKGMLELATGVELAAYFDAVMRETLLPSGRVQYFPLHRYMDGQVTSIVSGRVEDIQADRLVDGTLNRTEVPALCSPKYDVGTGVICIPPNVLPRFVGPNKSYVVVGAGKTGMDVACWLLDNGVNPDAIRWIVPRDSWVLDRMHFQPGKQFVESFLRSDADQIEALSEAISIADLFERLEAVGQLRRLDAAVVPTAYHCATLSDEELRQLRRIRQVIRLGRVLSIDADRITLEHGSTPTNASVIHIDCSASGLPPLPDVKVFDDNRINLLWVRQCQPVFSAAVIAFVEAHYSNQTEKNSICAPIPSPQVPIDWLRMMKLNLANRRRWASEPPLAKWLGSTRLNPFTQLVKQLSPSDHVEASHRKRFASHVEAAELRATELLAQLETELGSSVTSA